MEKRLVADTEQTPKPDAAPDKAVEQNPKPDAEPDKAAEQNPKPDAEPDKAVEQNPKPAEPCRKRSRSSSTKRKRNFALCGAIFLA